MKKSNTLAVLVLAAGTSSRLGKPKQLVLYEGKTLLWHTCSKALKLSRNVFVVLGAKQKECKEVIKDFDVNIIFNEEYEEGLSSSIKAGIKNVQSYEKVLVLLCDQPLMPLSHLEKLIQKSLSENKIISSFYKNNVAVPAIFPKSVYEQLLCLRGDKGAKAIIKSNSHNYIILEDELSFDVDTQDDVNKIKDL